MKKKDIIILGIEIFISILLVISSIFFPRLDEKIFLGGLLFLVILTIIFLGFPKSRYRFSKDIIIELLIVFLIYYLLIYLSGLYFGFLRSAYSLTFLSIIKNITPVVIAIILKEVLRYVILYGKEKNKKIIFLTIVLFFLLDTFRYDLRVNGTTELFELIALYILPSITKNIFLTWLVTKVGYIPAIIYSLLFYIPTYIIPIEPSLGVYLKSILHILLPVILLVYLYQKFVKQSLHIDVRDKKTLRNILMSIFSFILLIYVILISTLFPYYMLSIGSNSMVPVFQKGDCVIVKKVSTEKIDTIEEGDILVFTVENKVIVHRIVEITKNGNNYDIVTKGDNNDDNDNFDIKKSDIIGVVKGIIPYIGNPTIWLYEALNK